MGLMIWGKLPMGCGQRGGKPGFRALRPYSGRLGAGGKRTASTDRSPVQGIVWGELRPPAGGWCVCEEEQGPSPCGQVIKWGSLRNAGLRGGRSESRPLGPCSRCPHTPRARILRPLRMTHSLSLRRWDTGEQMRL